MLVTSYIVPRHRKQYLYVTKLSRWEGHYATSQNVAGSTPDEVNEFFFSIYLILPATLDPEVYSASNGNEYQKQNKNAYGE
jgi:hypothetical protein